jgi:peptide/nickel transport system substrate-binding protein
VRGRAWPALLAVVALAFVPVSSGATSTKPQTLTVSIPGAFKGCYLYNPSTSTSLKAVLDLVRPSAFTTEPNGVLTGANGPIADAELTSLSPQTVVYTLTPGWTWSNGAPFTGNDLISWWHQAAATNVSATDGYRDIASMTLAASADQITVVFSTPFADWNALFRAINLAGTATNCSLQSLATQPSLGPYRLISISSQEAVLGRNPRWQGPRARFKFVDIMANTNPLKLGATPYVDYRYSVSPGQLMSLSQRANLLMHVGSSDQLVTVGFSPHRVLPFQLAVRQFLSLALDRQSIINRSLSWITFNQGIANSELYSQGQTGYYGADGLGPIAQTNEIPNTTIPTSIDGDCTLCATEVLRAAGFARHGQYWYTAAGTLLEIRVVVGPTLEDQEAAAIIGAQWHAAGVFVVRTSAVSDLAVANDLAVGVDDVGIFTVTTGAEPFVTARAWTGVDHHDTFDIGWRSPSIDQWYAAALDTFNPDDAAVDYSQINQLIANEYWERPLFTLPSIVTWTNDVANVNGSVTLTGLIDQIPTWGFALPTVTP